VIDFERYAMVIFDYLVTRWVEIGSLLCAFGYGALHNSGGGLVLGPNYTCLSFLHGIALFPLCLLALAVLLPFEIPFQSEKLIFSGAAIIAIFSILEHRHETEV
jgi:hypothetical protein